MVRGQWSYNVEQCVRIPSDGVTVEILDTLIVPGIGTAEKLQPEFEKEAQEKPTGMPTYFLSISEIERAGPSYPRTRVHEERVREKIVISK